MKIYCRLIPILAVNELYHLFLWPETPGFFDSDEIVSFRLEAPISSLKKQRGDETDWLEGKVFYGKADGTEVALTVKIEARGNFRRRRSTCNFPPYWLNFKKSEVKGTLFEGLDKVKIVSHCNDGWQSFEPLMFTEYLIYKTYNILTDLSFRVRPARINYLDTDNSEGVGEFGAFFIEHNDSLEARLNAAQVKERFILPSRYNIRELCMAEMFQFFVGNTDFSYFASEGECCHNGKVFSLEGANDGLIPVPYDFDMSGLVDAPYAEPNPNFPITSVKHRYYRGVDPNREVLQEVIRQYLKKKKEIYALWENSEVLDDRYRAKALDYIDEFYEIFKSPREINIKIINKIRHFESAEEMVQEAIEKEERKAARR